MNSVFNYCVKILMTLSQSLGITYEEINVYIFCIIWPLLTITQTIYIIQLKKHLKKFTSKLIS